MYGRALRAGRDGDATMAAIALPAHLADIEKNLHELERQRAIYTLLGLGITTLLVVSGISLAESSNAGSFSRGIQNFWDYPADMIEDAWEKGWSWWPLLAKHLPELLATFNMALFSTFVGFVLAVFLSFFASSNIVGSAAVVQVTRRFFDVARSFPELVIALVLLYLMGKSELPAVIAITIHTTGVLGKLFSEVIENVDNKPLDGLQSVGGGWWKRLRFGVIPQVLPLFLSYGLLRLEINVRASTILGFVGAGGIGEALNTEIQWRNGDEICAIVVLLVLTITMLDYISSYFRNRLTGAHR